MTSYRFCRPDDMNLLIKAINTCVLVHEPNKPSLDISEYKRLVRELNLWSSSSMVALEKDKDDVVATCIGCKRENATLIYLIGARPDHLRKGHVSHMLESLSRKLSVLGPKDIVAEVPMDCNGTVALFQKLDYKKVCAFTDFVCDKVSSPTSNELNLTTLSVEDILNADLLDDKKNNSWERSLVTIQNSKDALKAIGVIFGNKIQFHAIYRVEPECKNIIEFGGNEGDLSRFLSEVTHHLLKLDTAPVTLRKANDKELSDSLQSIGFRPTRNYIQFHTQAIA